MQDNTSEREARSFGSLRLLDIDQLSDLWGVKKSWIYDQVESGNLPVIRLGGHLRFDEQDLRDYLMTRKGAGKVTHPRRE